MNNHPLKPLLDKHKQLIHSDFQKVSSHVQREQDEWIMNTLMIEGVNVPFKYKRKKYYQSLVGKRVNLTYYMAKEAVAGFELDVMNVVRVKLS